MIPLSRGFSQSRFTTAIRTVKQYPQVVVLLRFQKVRKMTARCVKSSNFRAKARLFCVGENDLQLAYFEIDRTGVGSVFGHGLLQAAGERSFRCDQNVVRLGGGF